MTLQHFMFSYQDTLNELNANMPLGDKLAYVHRVLRERHDAVNRIAITIYDPKTDILKTFVDSNGDASPLEHYEARLSETEALSAILEQGKPRVVNDLDIFAPVDKKHTRRISAGGYEASYTMPMYIQGTFFGFVFFNSKRKGAFSLEVLHDCDVFGHLIALVVGNELSAFKTLLATLKTARELTHQRDCETGAHLDRMSRFARLIAQKLATEGKYGFSDEFIEHVFVFSPLHDIGKIGIPDRVLLKPAKLTAEEHELMRTHTTRGLEIVDMMLENFELDQIQHVDVLRNIARFHHEAINGSGYPDGLQGDDIPIEARIVAVADVFDALTSRRPYKPAWSNDEAFDSLRRLAGTKLDPECVQALIENREDVEQIQRQFAEDTIG